ncbi:MAG TPA: alpha-L-rhamnosidase, partial [Candidatus Blautia faecavium]|nr:alpha-L-rhamnosidase [Candidatus Blautia faecavium]
NENILKIGGAKKMSSYMGYYILAARAKAGDISGALESMKDYWGGMISLGATTFWEDFDVEWMNGAAPIDRLPREGETDIHGTKGSYCYKGFRHSLCHGWASGPVSWLSRYILGVEILKPGCKKLKIRPELGTLEWAEGVFPTPLGDVAVKVWKKDDGETAWEVNAPKEIEIING